MHLRRGLRTHKHATCITTLHTRTLASDIEFARDCDFTPIYHTQTFRPLLSGGPVRCIRDAPGVYISISIAGFLIARIKWIIINSRNARDVLGIYMLRPNDRVNAAMV